MFGFILGLVLAVCAIVFWVLERTYQHVPARELKRLARRGDEVAALLYRPVAYGVSLQVFLAVVGMVLAALALVSLVSSLGAWLAILLLIVVGGVGGLIFVPSGDLTRSSLWLARHAAPPIAWVLEHTHPVLDSVGRFVKRHQPLHFHTGLYEKADLVELLERQKAQPDSRINMNEIALLQHALTFGDRTVADALVPKRVVKMVRVSDSIGPVLMSDLHASGHSRFPVYADGKRDNIVGILYLHDLVGAKHTGTVEAIMSTKLTYVHEDFTLQQALQAFLKTKQHLFLVVNGFEELVGIITIEDVLEQMIGKQIVDEFDHYDDLRAVAAAAAKAEHKAHDEPKAEAAPTSDAEEVVE